MMSVEEQEDTVAFSWMAKLVVFVQHAASKLHAETSTRRVGGTVESTVLLRLANGESHASLVGFALAGLLGVALIPSSTFAWEQQLRWCRSGQDGWCSSKYDSKDGLLLG